MRDLLLWTLVVVVVNILVAGCFITVDAMLGY